ncbi:hypothetical protein KY290_027550 [Solanum tuberosum]|uniref:RNase H type-1 domain-containing protein n=1 Tax=Solanum tuberosum TaxID=4113 RepID=A0ABQ7UGM7_SOLTU|nr:hypothetical protein KY289_026806 [Solanum tuberosum]KAH0665285.1 hypothetical protein KY285_026491 [Solanum tuberosum]KAH0748318.1 hypothetical protein KY290_027550 [Solanum tuberosum]
MEKNPVQNLVLQILPDWEQFYNIVEIARDKISHVLVLWLRPKLDFYKLNTDGCSKANPGLSAGGGIIRDNQGRNLEVEVDSKLLVDCILNLQDTPWILWDKIIIIGNLLQRLDNWSLQHYYREGNKVADCLANWALQCANRTWITHHHQLPSEARGELILNRMSVPSLRTITKKNSFSLDRDLYRIFTFDVP